jgi:hypothetical protein
MGIFDNDRSYQKLKELRDSGYDGPVDQNGNARPEDRHLFANWGGRDSRGHNPDQGRR